MAKSNRKTAWQNKVSNPSQIGGIETSVLDNGLGKGTRIAWVNTGSGLRYKVVVDRGLDIVDAFYNQHSLVWLSRAGVTSPRPDANKGLEWLYSFGGGLLTTCGLTHVGGPEGEGFDERGLHPKNLSRCLEDSATLTSPLIPWNSGGAFMAATMGISPFLYLPYAFLNLANPLVSIFYGFTGITMERAPEDEGATT